jgi:hypothetical protein
MLAVPITIIAVTVPALVMISPVASVIVTPISSAIIDNRRRCIIWLGLIIDHRRWSIKRSET